MENNALTYGSFAFCSVFAVIMKFHTFLEERIIDDRNHSVVMKELMKASGLGKTSVQNYTCHPSKNNKIKRVGSRNGVIGR